MQSVPLMLLTGAPSSRHIVGEVFLLLLFRSTPSRLGTEWLQPFRLPVVSATTVSMHSAAGVKRAGDLGGLLAGKE